MRQIREMAFKFGAGYVAGMIFVFCLLAAQGSPLASSLKLLLLWLPIGFIYGLIIMPIASRSKVLGMPLSLGICGACVGSFPLVSGLWPTYWMRLDAALVVLGIQCSVLLMAMVARYCVHRVIGR
jgi:hypothetical protein